ncbi:hypothetical protein [Staphylococcus epidermidis]|uniref:hypothetical protein n=2 Tax=Staphylococcus epidermidis TaxID=1282 RepID=UPI0018E4E68A|nr:hypothetical protein [Staphylococcus epidermidis]
MIIMLLAILWFIWGGISYFVVMFGIEFWRDKWMPGVIGAGALLLFLFWIMKSIHNYLTMVYLY